MLFSKYIKWQKLRKKAFSKNCDNGLSQILNILLCYRNVAFFPTSVQIFSSPRHFNVCTMVSWNNKPYLVTKYRNISPPFG